jgi:hypothetical protein
MRTIVISHALLAVLGGMCVTASAQDKAAILKKLESEYSLTKTTADQTDIVTAGSVLVLQKDNLLMVATTTTGNPCSNTYKNGKFTQNGACRANEKFKKFSHFGLPIPGADQAPQVTTRTYVTGEKFWVTRIDLKEGKDAGVVMDFFTDAVNDVRYRTSLTIPFKGGMPSADDALKLVQEVVTVQPPEDDKKQEAKGNGGQAAPQGGQQAPAAEAGQQQAAAAPAADAPPPPLDAPPPPPDAPAAPPPTVAMGQTPDQVVAILGQPQKKADLGTKQIYFYKDVKVTFVNGKVKDIQ